MAATSGVLGSYIYGSQNQPSLSLYEWDVSEPTSPDGYRSVVSGVATFVKQLGTSAATAMQFEDTVLDFSDLSAEYAARVQCFTFVNTTGYFRLSNMRVWMPSGTALDDGAHLEVAASGEWIYNSVLPSGAGFAMPTGLPSSQNVFRQDGDPEMWLVADDHASQYVYLGLTVPSGLAFGRYGIDGTGDLVFRVTFDWFDTTNVTYLTPENYPNYPRNWAYPAGAPNGATSGWHYNEDEVWMRAPTAKNDELLLAFVTVGGYNTSITEPSEWNKIYEAGQQVDQNSYWKFRDDADASGQLYQWAMGFSDSRDAVGHILRIVNGGTPIASGYDKAASYGDQVTFDNLEIAQKATVIYFFSTEGASQDITELPSDMIVWASGAGSSDPSVPPWAIGYKSYPQAGVDGGTTFQSTNGTIGCTRVVVPYEAQHFLPPATD